MIVTFKMDGDIVQGTPVDWCLEIQFHYYYITQTV
jgi:hypothetical protein